MSYAHMGSNRVAAVAVFVAGLVLLGLGAVFAYAFGQLAGQTEGARDALSYTGIALNALKALLPFVIYAAWQQSHRVILAGSIIALLVCCFVSLVNMYGYGAAQRAASAETAQSRPDIEARISRLPEHRPTAVVAPLFKAERDRAKKAKLESELGAAKLEDELRAQLAAAPTGPSAEAQIVGLSALTSLNAVLARGVVSGAISLGLELGELIAFFAAAMLWRRPEDKTPVAAPIEQGTSQPVILTSQAATSSGEPPRQRVTVQAWLAEYLPTVTGPARAGEAYDAYATEWKRRRRKPIARLDFGRKFDAAAKAAGLAKKNVAGRLEYQAA